MEGGESGYSDALKIIESAAESNNLKFLWETKDGRTDASSNFNQQLVKPIVAYRGPGGQLRSLMNLRDALENACLVRINFALTNLSGANLRNANLQESNGRGMEFSDANMYGADLQKTNFEDADFTNVDLQKANFQGANLTGASLSKTLLRGATFSSEQLLSADKVTVCMVDTATFIKNNFSEDDLVKFQDKMKSQYLNFFKDCNIIKDLSNYLLKFIVPNEKINSLRQEELVLNITSLAAGISKDWTSNTRKVVEAGADRIVELLKADPDQKKSVAEDPSLLKDLEFIDGQLNHHQTKINNASVVTYYLGFFALRSPLSAELAELKNFKAKAIDDSTIHHYYKE